MKSIKRKLFSLTILMLLSSKLTSQSLQIDYYGIISTAADSNMLKMAQDIFLNQLKSIDGVSVDDKRQDLNQAMTALPSFSREKEKVIFYAEITGEKNQDGTPLWNCRFNAINPSSGLTHSKNESYESYYKILTGSKTAIETVLNDVRTSGGKAASSSSQNFQNSSKSMSDLDIESLAGTWTGEPYADKIIILRGGRGFVIFKNGATMNIKITHKNASVNGNATNLEISQVGKSNASFFPELPRETALILANDAKPITWNFKLTSSGTLEGTKTSLSASSDGQAVTENYFSVWTKQ